MQTGRTENANANNAKKTQKKIATYKGKTATKAVQNGSKIFGAGYILSF